MFLNINLLYICFLFLIITYTITCEANILLEPSKVILSKFKDEKYFHIVEINRDLLKPNHFYKIMVHHLGSVIKI
jgi:hypothetical protein